MNLIDTIDRMAIQASRYRTTRLSAESRKSQADDDSEAIETVRAMQEALRNIIRSAELNQSAVNGFLLIEAQEALRRAEGNAG